MRKKLIGLLVLAGLAGILLVPTFGIGRIFGQQNPGGKKGGKKGTTIQPGDIAGMFQQGGGKKGKGGAQGMQFPGMGNMPGMGGMPGRGGQGGMGGLAGMMDPNQIFDLVAKGGDSIVIANAGMLKGPLTQWAQENGNANGIITRQEFASFFPTMMNKVQGGFGGANGAGGFDVEQAAIKSFERADRDGDGKLNENEMPTDLKAVWKTYDKDNDGYINLDEYKRYFADKVSKNGGGDGGAAIAVMEEDWEKRPTVFRAGHLPPELRPGGMAGWFSQYDKNSDGQVGLYEWKQYSGGRSIAEFEQMDRNGDGLLTAEEVLWYLKIKSGASIGTLNDPPTIIQVSNMQQWPSFGQGGMNPAMGKKGPKGGGGPGNNGPGGPGGKGGKGGGGPGGGKKGGGKGG